MTVETRIALDKQIEKQSKRSLIKCSRCPFDQKVIGMSCENLLVAMNRHTRIFVVLACTASLVKQKRRSFLKTLYTPICQKIIKYSNMLYLWYDWHSFQCDALKWATCTAILGGRIQNSPQNGSSDAF